MRRSIYTDLRLGMPVLVLAAGKVTDDELQFIHSLCDEKITCDFKTIPVYSDACAKYGIDCPQQVRLQFILTTKLSEYLDLCQILTRNNTSIPFFSSFATLVFIDHTANPKIQEVRESIQKMIPRRHNTGYVYYKASEDLISAFSDDTHISFAQYSTKSIRSHLIQFVATIAFKLLQADPDFINYQAHQHSRSNKSILIQLTPCCMSPKPADVVRAITNTSKLIEVSENAVITSTLYYILALLEYDNPGIIKQNKILERVMLHNAPWMPEYEPINDVIGALSVSGGYAIKAKLVHRMIDTGLQVVSFGFVQYASRIFDLIQQHKTYSDMHLRATALLEALVRSKKYARAAYFANQFASVFTEISVNFKIEAIKLVTRGGCGDKMAVEIAAPIILELTKVPNVSPNILAKLIIDMISRAQTLLPAHIQKSFFKKLSGITLPNAIDADFGFRITKVNAGSETSGVRPCAQRVGPKKSNSSDSLFIYNSFKKSAVIKNDLYAVINEPFKFSLEIYSPFCGSLPALISFPDTHNLRFERKVAILRPQTSTTVDLTLRSVSMDEFVIPKVYVSVFCSLTTLLFEEPLRIYVAPQTGQFCVRTDLVTRSYYIGEMISFNVWITNTGSANITNCQVCYNGETTTAKTPIKPGRMECVKCVLEAEQNMDSIDIVSSCSTADNGYEAFQTIKVPIKVAPCVIAVSLLPVQKSVEAGTDITKIIFLAMAITNKAKKVMNVDLSFDDNEGLVDDPIFLSKKPQKHVVTPGTTVTCMLPVSRQKLKALKKVATPAELVATTAYYEEAFGRRLTFLERQEVTRLADIVCYVKDHTRTEWTTIDGRKGHVVLTFMPDQSIIKELDIVRTTPIYKFIIKGDEVDDIVQNQPLTLRIDFGNMKVMRCTVDIDNLIDVKYGILWDGELSKELESTVYDFKLCFTQTGYFKFTAKYQSNESVNGEVIIFANVVPMN